MKMMRREVIKGGRRESGEQDEVKRKMKITRREKMKEGRRERG